MTRPVSGVVAPHLPGLLYEPADKPYGARSDAAVLVGELLTRHVPALARGELEIVAIARQPGVLSKVAVRRHGRTRLSARPVSLVVGVGADQVNQVSTELGGERLHVLQWQGDPARYIADALGIGFTPAIDVQVAAREAAVLLGSIDLRGIRGRRGVNLRLASQLTAWRIRLRNLRTSAAWQALELARDHGGTAPALVEARVSRGLLVSVYGLHALLPIGQVRGVRRSTPAEQVDHLLRGRLGHELRVRVLRLDPDHGQAIVSETLPGGRQLVLL